MKKLFVTSVLTLAVGLSFGCTGLASSIKAASKDNAFLYGETKTIYGSGFFVRDGRSNSGTTVSDQGAVTSTPGTNSNFSQPNKMEITPDQFAALVRNEAARLVEQQKTNTVSKSK